MIYGRRCCSTVPIRKNRFYTGVGRVNMIDFYWKSWMAEKGCLGVFELENGTTGEKGFILGVRCHWKVSFRC